jgi:hypothetical protein
MSRFCKCSKSGQPRSLQTAQQRGAPPPAQPLGRRRRCSGLFFAASPVEPPVTPLQTPAIGSGARVRVGKQLSPVCLVRGAWYRFR